MFDSISLYGVAVGSLLAFKLLLSIKPRASRPKHWGRLPRNLHVSAIITVYNEDPDTLTRCLASLLGQTRRPDSVTIIDDCSTDRRALAIAHTWWAHYNMAGIDYRVVEFSRNQGKRHGLAAGFERRRDAEVYLAVDCDTILADDAVQEALKPFANRNVHAVTGVVLALNRGRNLLTRLIDMRYTNAFLVDRVAYSRLGSVLCVSGAMALYRGRVVRKYLDDFLTQTFLGQPATFGDDRRLTYYCLVEGRAVIQPSAIVHTAVPERMTHFLRQQTRWTKSFLREASEMLRTWRVGRIYWWLNLLEIVTWLVFTSALLVAFTLAALHANGPSILIMYSLYASAVSYIRSMHYLRGASTVPVADRIATFALAPLYALMNIVVMIPMRFWAIATLKNASWGTRAAGVEIGASARPADPHGRLAAT